VLSIRLSRSRRLALILALACAPLGWAQMRIVNYNIAQLNGNQAALQDVIAAINADDKPGYAIAPHVYVFQEVNSGDQNTLLGYLNAAAPAGVTYALGTYTNTGEDCCAGAQAMFYRSDIMAEQANEHVDIYTQAGRDTDRWRLRYTDYTGDDAKFYVYSSHLKAGSTASDETDRNTGAIAIRANSDALPEGTHIIYMGDFNLSSNSEAAYQTFIAAGPGKARDALGTGTWSGSGQAIKHTQSPRSTGDGLTGGGMDDRFDFQLTSAEFRDDEGYSYIAGTYRSFGNDGNHYDLAINSGTNSYYPGDIPRSNALADDLRNASDHIPVIAEYQLPALMQASLVSDFGRIIQGALFTVELSVWNDADVIVQEGADELDYTSVISGALSGTCDGSHLALDPADTCDLTVDTSTVGTVNGQVDLATDSQAATNPTLMLGATGEIVKASNASFDSGNDVTSLTISMMLSPDTGAVNLSPVDVHNRGFDASTALLDVDAVAAPATPFAFDGGLQSGIGATPASLSFSFDTTGGGTADFSETITIDVSDEDIPGQTASQLSLTLQVFLRQLIGDANGDCTINVTDLGNLLAAFGSATGDTAYNPTVDFNNSGTVDITDLGILLAAFGQNC
jgi:endonuclease/exonuclease/phosphatase family metal-dependent hydrolase